MSEVAQACLEMECEKSTAGESQSPTNLQRHQSVRSTARSPRGSDDGRTLLRAGSYGTSAFKALTPRFKQASPITSKVDSLDLSVTSTFGKLGPKVSFTKASDRFRTSEPATVDAQTYFYTPTMQGAVMGRSGSCRDLKAESEPTASAPARGVLAGGGERFPEQRAVTANAELYLPPSTIKCGPKPEEVKPKQTGPRFSQRYRHPSSTTTKLEEAMSKIDFYVPPGMAAKCSPKSPGGRVTTTGKRFVDPAPVTQNADFHTPVAETTSLTLKSVGSSASLRSKTPRFESTKPVTAATDFYVPPGFVDEILRK